MKTIRLIITDDHPVIIDGLRSALARCKDIELIAEMHNGKELLQHLESTETDVILMDINMPEMNGIEACKTIIKKYKNTKVIAFSQYDDKRFVKRILKNGAAGYLLKNTASSDIIEAIKQVHAGEMYLSKELMPLIADLPVSKKGKNLFPDLSKRELEVIQLICQEQNTQEIADSLFISPHTVESHRANILLKLDVRNTAGLVRWAVENEIV